MVLWGFVFLGDGGGVGWGVELVCLIASQSGLAETGLLSDC